ncbi:MAG: YhcH/YjgK/YiaL family protein [Spirochaetes bacterium]|uniref:YhcH/YjgK/YiaL family protein n=1 Tax=Candidatus Ornithospirochaeta stercoripullorum TaxID=2840899 RepID=A0A9D9H4K6_9SPIO|nr:YhcH/YjgK/YiaL family protein [Candidatus Ornithospirochaeta stercoripullorum]
MFSTEIGKENLHDFASPAFKTAFEFLKRKDLAELAEGSIDLENGVRASVQHYDSIDAANGSFESHEKLIDVQYVIEGKEYCYVCRRDGLTVKTPYNADNDITFYNETEKYSSVLLLPGDFVVLGPEDVHKPRVKVNESEPVKKIVLKVPVEI